MHKTSLLNPELKSEHSSMCLAAAIVIGKAYATDVNLYNFLTYYRNYTDLIDALKELCQNANVNLTNGGSIDEIIQFQNHLGCDYRITVFASRDGRDSYFKSCHSNYKYTINLLLDCEHYSVVLEPTAAFATSYFCNHCSAAYTTQLGHRKCAVKCNSCLCSPPCEKEIDIVCSTCNRTFFNPKCYMNHKNIDLCSKMRMCTE